MRLIKRSEYDCIHSEHLDLLIHNLSEIDENKKNIKFVLKEPLWMPEHTPNEHSLCDLIIAYLDDTARAVELKHSPHSYIKARHQLECGKMFIEDALGYVYIGGKVVYYDRLPFRYEVV